MKPDSEHCDSHQPVYWNFNCTDLATFCKYHDMDDCDYPHDNDTMPRFVHVEKVMLITGTTKGEGLKELQMNLGLP